MQDDPGGDFSDLLARLVNAAAPIGAGDKLAARVETIVYDGQPDLWALAEAMSKYRSDFEAANERRWHQAFNWVDIQISHSNFVAHALSNSDYVKQTPFAVKDACVDVVGCSVAVGHGVLCLLRAGFPRGAHARWRTLYELVVVASVLALGNATPLADIKSIGTSSLPFKPMWSTQTRRAVRRDDSLSECIGSTSGAMAQRFLGSMDGRLS